MTVAIVALIIILPFYLGTKTYPIAIVTGNSMYPNLQNGDLVLFGAEKSQWIPNGTVIVFVQSDTGVSALDSLTKPTVIHRIVGSFVQADGKICYTTKGDNNKVNDSSSVPSDHVLGTPVLVIPKIGIVFVFLSSPQGLVATIGFITIFYLGSYDTKQKDQEKKEKFLGELKKMTINGDLRKDLFEKFEFAVKYPKQAQALEDKTTRSILEWINQDSLSEDWQIDRTACLRCKQTGIVLRAEKNTLTLCTSCDS